jgi:hypothetical protein
MIQTSPGFGYQVRLFTLALLAFLLGMNLLPGQEASAPKEEIKKPAVPRLLTPTEFLDEVSQQTKVLWRKLYRDPPPVPSTERMRVSFMLGGLVADGYLALKAGDAQQFKNNNQDIIKYCKVLGLAEKVTPGLLAQSKMAEGEDWAGTLKQVAETQLLIENLLNGQRDEDLALLTNLGMWIRLYEITSSIVHNDPTLPNKLLTIGSVQQVEDLAHRFQLLSETARKEEPIQIIGTMLDMLARHWSTADQPTQEVVDFTWEKVSYLMNKLTPK